MNLAKPEIARYRAFDYTKQCLNDKKVYITANKLMKNDYISKMAKSWFDMKSLGK